MYNANFYKNYGTYLAEQVGVISDELDPRLKGYLENDDFLEMIMPEFENTPDGETKEIQITDKQQFGIIEDDKVFLKVNKSDPKNPMFNMWIMNDEYIYGDIDFDLLATIIHNAADQGSVIGYVGNFIGSLFGAGDAGDAGTDEDTIVAAAAALHQLAHEKSVDAMLYFDRLDDVYSSKYGESLKDMLETEFSGRAEVSALQAYRREITPSVLRGMNPLMILGDIALTVVTLGGSSAFMAGVRGTAGAAQAANIAGKTTKAGAALARGSMAIGKGVGYMAKVTRFGKLLAKLPMAERLAALSKGGITVGKEFVWVGTTGKKTTGIAKIVKYTEGADHAFVKFARTGQKFKATGPGTKTSIAKIFQNLNKPTQKAVATAGNLAPAAVIAAMHSEGGTEAAPDASMGGKAAEVMGWYDTQTADPRAYIQAQKGAAATGLAEIIFDLKKGGGLFGNTTNQEELLMALTVLSLDGEGAKEVQAAYKRLDGTNVYAVLDDELGGDMAMFAKAHWTACTGEGAEYAAGIKNIRSRVKTVKK